VRDHAFADLVKATSGFNTLSGTDAPVGPDGWPTVDFTVPLWSGHAMDPGRYVVSFSGPSNTVVDLNDGFGSVQKVGTSGSVQNYVVDIPAGTQTLTMRFTDTSGQVKNLKVLQPNTASGQVWSTKYVDHLKSLKPETIRVMDMVRANSNSTSTWADRPNDEDATWHDHGAPWHHLIDLANMVGSNFWATVPINASDDYVRQLASLIKTRLNPNLGVYVELANEVWSNATYAGKQNTMLAQQEVANNPGSNLDFDGNTNTETIAERRYARRTVQISNLFKEVWTTTFNGTTAQPNPINGRVRVMLGGQATRLARFDNMLNFINDQYGEPKSFIYGGGLAWYFGLNKYADQFSTRTDLTKEEVLEGMGLSISAYENESRFTSAFNRLNPWGLKLMAYELGVDTFGAKNIQAKADASLDPRMAGLMVRFWNAFKNQGGDSAQWFRLGANTFITPNGTWSLTDNLNNVNAAKMQGFRMIRGLAPTI
jgi:hypothetical protein